MHLLTRHAGDTIVQRDSSFLGVKESSFPSEPVSGGVSDTDGESRSIHPTSYDDGFFHDGGDPAGSVS